MIRRLCKVALAAGIAALLASPALAQPGRPGGPGGGGMFLLQNKSVQEELKISDKQKDDLKKINDKIDEARKDAAEKTKDITDRTEKREKMQELTKTVMEDAKKDVAKLLDEKQNKRFKEIQLQSSLQFQGPSVFTQEDVQKDLKLSDEQKEKIGSIVKDVEKERQSLFSGGGGRPNPEAFQKMQTLNKEGLEKAVDVLKDDQKKTWKEMQGEKFEIKFERPGGAGGGRGGQGRGNRNPNP